MDEPLLDIRDLEIRYSGTVLGVGTVDLRVIANEIFGLGRRIGERQDAHSAWGFSAACRQRPGSCVAA